MKYTRMLAFRRKCSRLDFLEIAKFLIEEFLEKLTFHISSLILSFARVKMSYLSSKTTMISSFENRPYLKHSAVLPHEARPRLAEIRRKSDVNGKAQTASG